MNYLIIFSTICLSAFVGNILAKKYVYRDLFFNEVIKFFMRVKNNVEFWKIKIEDIFNEFEKSDEGKFKSVILDLKKIITNSQEVDQGSLNKLSFLSLEEKNNIINFLKGASETNEKNFCENINIFLKWLEEKKNNAYSERIKNVGTVYKLSVAVGLTFGILII